MWQPFRPHRHLFGNEHSVSDDVIIFVGGAPVTQAYTDCCGADGYAPDANSLVREVRKKLSQIFIH
ncbi:MAG: hypothetical protein DWQ04_10360 [Chloroflexi bacterium]|nr:MAG: hypothetical protein DWQ04_10360 [Chloroflexota bacterium]